MTDSKYYILFISLVVAFISLVVINNPPGIRCFMVDNKKECVPVRLF